MQPGGYSSSSRHNDADDNEFPRAKYPSSSTFKTPLPTSSQSNPLNHLEAYSYENKIYSEKMSEEKILNNRRLIITQIVMENFKSYYGKTSFTSIVGPNGSGKSNTIESLLFVFGKRARWMRLNKLSELIHISAKHPDLTKASVEVFFEEIIDKDDPNAYEPIRGTSFSVKRTIKKCNTSIYEINNEEVSQADVINLLKSKGVDLDHNRFLILQGEVEQVSLMKPKSNDPNDPGLLEFLEDIIGTSRFKEEIDQIEADYDRVADTKKEKWERMKYSETELKKLDEVKDEAIQFVRREKEMYQFKNTLFQIDKWRCEGKLKRRAEKIKNSEIKIKELKEKYNLKRKENEAFERKFYELKERDFQIEKRMKKLKQSYSVIQEKDEKLQIDRKFHITNEVKYQEQLKELEKQYQAIIQKSCETEKLLPQKEEMLSELSGKKEEVTEKLNDLYFQMKGKTQNLVQKKSDLEKELNPLVIEQARIQNTIKELQNEKELIMTKLQFKAVDFQGVETQHKELTEKLESFGNYMDQLNSVSNEIQSRIKRNQDRFADISQKERAIQQQIQEIEGKVCEFKQSSNEAKSKNTVLSELMNAQKRKELKGIVGRLGDLGTISDKYDVAITTACGQLEYIVVNKLDDAQRAVEFLRINRIGKASFIALDKIDYLEPQMKKPFEAPPGSERLFDLIKIKNSAFKIAFYFALRDTLVCNDIDTATDIAFGKTRYRVVTLGGNLIDISGTMSGGGKPRRGGMSSKLREEISQEEIQKIEDELLDLKDNAKRFQLEKQRLEIELGELKKDLERTEKEKQKTSLEINYREKAIEDIVTKLMESNKFSADKASLDKDLAVLEKKLAQFTGPLEKLNGEIAKVQRNIEVVDKEIERIGGEELKQTKKLKTEIEREFDEINQEVEKSRAVVKNRGKALMKNQKEQEDAKEKLQSTLMAKEKIEKDTKLLEEEALMILAEQQQLEPEKEKFEAEVKKIEEENATAANELNQIIDERNRAIEERDAIVKEMSKLNEEKILAEKKLETNRADFKMIRAEYDFLADLEEIEQHKFSDLSKVSIDLKLMEDSSIFEIELDATALNISRINDSQFMQKSQRIKKNFDSHLVFKYEVDETIPEGDLEILERAYNDITMKQTFLEQKIKENPPNINSINEYRQKYLEHKKKLDELFTVQKNLNDLKNILDDKKKARYNQFMSGFQIISKKLKETYQILTMGGDAELELIDSFDPFSDGIIFTVRPPKKGWKQMAKLSGGEKTLCSLSLIFALHYYRPTPLYIMDEIDAALDYKNVGIVGKFVKEKTKNAQFVIISLRTDMFELADQLVGIYKTHDMTKTMAITPLLINCLNQIKKDENKENSESGLQIKKQGNSHRLMSGTSTARQMLMTPDIRQPFGISRFNVHPE